MDPPTAASAVTPSRPPPPVDISTIEAAKENIVPLHSGRSASQLASVFAPSSTRSGLGVKLEADHARFRTQIDAVEAFEQSGEWPDGKDGLSLDEVSQLAEDPLDISHQYVRFIIANYPAGASAANRLVPVLEETTRKFLHDGRYANDPRYFRLWAHYAKNMENPEDCYRFLFAKGVAEKLAALYEEYAKVLEAAGKRKQADQVYQLGINRKATPLDRLKRSHLDFQARMLVAPPLPSPPRAATSTSESTRPILSSSRPLGPPSTGGTGVGPKGNGSMFAVFRDEAANESSGKSAEWDDFGTVQSRKRENEVEKKEWSGETIPQKNAVAAPTSGGLFKLEVYRDETATALPHAHSLNETDVFARSTRAPSEAEQLRSNPFKNYSSADVDLLSRDPLENLEVLAPPAKEKKKVSGSSGDKKVRSSSSSSSAGSSKTRSKASSSASTAASGSASAAPGEKKERVAIDLRAIYPAPGVEYSFEELKARKRFQDEADTWNGWESFSAWSEEVSRTGRTSYLIDRSTGWPVLHDVVTGAPLYDFLPRPVPPTPEPAPVVEAARVASSSPCPASPGDVSPVRQSSQPAHSLMSPSPPRMQPPTTLLDDSPDHDDESTPAYPPLDPNRPPSPTMNTKAANAMIDDLFAKTLDFTRFNPRSSGQADGSDSDDEDGEPSTDESEEDDDGNAWSGGPLDLGASQFSTQQAMQASEVSSDAGFVPFSQTRSQMGDDSSFFGSQDPSQQQQRQPHHPPSAYAPGLFALNEDDESLAQTAQDENVPPPPAPMQLFRDTVPATPSTGGFRPITKTGSSARAPLGAKVVGGGLVSAPPPQQPLFSVFQDQPGPVPSSQVGAFGDEVVPSTQASENHGHLAFAYEEAADQADFEAPLRDDDSPERLNYHDGYAMGRRERGVPSRYAPFVDNMTPITERTLEITAAMNTHHSSLSASTRSRRESAFENPLPVAEDDEPSTEGEDEEDGDRAFVAEGRGAAERSTEEDDSSDASSTSSSSESDDDDDGDGLTPPAPMLPMLSAASHFDVRPDVPPVPEQAHETAFALLSLGHDVNLALSHPSGPEGLVLANDQGEPGDAAHLVVVGGERLPDPEPVNPYDREMLQARLASLDVPTLRHSNVVDLSSATSDKLVKLQKMAAKHDASKGKERTGSEEPWQLELDGEILSVREKLGEGSFGAVYRIALPLDEEDAAADSGAPELCVAVKVEKPTNLWEFHVLDQVQSRVSARTSVSIIAPHRLYAYADESFLLLDLCSRGSLLDAVNKAPAYDIAPSGPNPTGMDELLAIFFTIELLRTLEGMHSSGFIHGDLKIDNCLLRFDGDDGACSTTYDATGSNGWGARGLKVIDFGRTVDLSMFPRGQRFWTDLRTDQYDCAEMRTGQPWTFEPDYHGAASIAYCLLFGHYMETESVVVDQSTGRTKRAIKQAFRRYHQVELWTKLFDMLLNPKDVRPDQSLPITNELAHVRHEMEEWLVENCSKNGKCLKTLLAKLARASLAR
ncbi:hypothetical protein JCM10212_003867 [Sporobolomyces blumeae]